MTHGVFLLIPDELNRANVANIQRSLYQSQNRRRPEVSPEAVLKAPAYVVSELRGMMFRTSFDIEGVTFLYLLETDAPKGSFDRYPMASWVEITMTDGRWRVAGMIRKEKPVGMTSRIEIVMETVNRED